MLEAGLQDVVLTGYRNDLARMRILQAVGEPITVSSAEPLPRVVFAALPAEEAEARRRELVALGGQVSLVPTGSLRQKPRRESSERQSRRPWALALAAGSVLAVALLRERPRPEPVEVVTRAVRPQRVTVPAVQPAEPAAAPAELPVAAEVPPNPRATAMNNEAVALAQEGRFEPAVEKLRGALLLSPGDPALRKNLQAVYVSWGVESLNREDFPPAIEKLDLALELGDHLEALYGLGVAHLRRSETPAAQSFLERAVALQPKDPRVLVALAEAYERQDRRADALDLLHRAREAGARDADLAQRIERLGREVDAEWDFVESTTPHFRISFADTQDRVSVSLVREVLEAAYRAVSAKFQETLPDRVAVVLYTQQDFHGITQTPDWAGGAFDGRIKLPVRGLDATDETQLLRVVRHELAHAFIRSLSADRCPVWLNEGLAVWAEESEDGERIDWAERTLAGHRLFRFSQLGGPFARFGAGEAERAYAQSYLAVRRLVERQGERRIPELLRALRSQNIEEAFRDVYRDNFALFEEKFLRERAEVAG